MSWLTDNVRWVHSITLEGNRLTADDVVMRRDWVVGARIDRLGVRPSFMFVLLLFAICLALSAAAFLQTLQFFQPDYTVFVLSLIPLPGLAFFVLRLRPRRHFTVLLGDGSVLCVHSTDAGFQKRCLEAFERLWAEPEQTGESLYLHAAHRSVDIAPAPANESQAADLPVEQPVQSAPPLPVFEDDEPINDVLAELQSSSNTSADGDPPLLALPSFSIESPWPDEVAPFEDEDLLKPGDQDALELPSDATPEDLLEALLEPADPSRDGLSEAVSKDLVEAVQVELDPELVDLADEPAEDFEADLDLPIEPEVDLPVEAVAEEGHDSAALEVESEAEPEPKIVEAPDSIPDSAFVELRPKIEALVRLLRERSKERVITDSVDILDLMTRRGCAHPREVRALARSLRALRERMDAYPTAIELLDDVAATGGLPPLTDPE